MKILLVEDNRKFANEVIELLTPHANEISWVETVGEAIVLCKTKQFDHILSDNNLPGRLTGMDFVFKLRESGQETKFTLYTSGNDFQGFVDLALESGANKVMTNATIKSISEWYFELLHKSTSRNNDITNQIAGT